MSFDRAQDDLVHLLGREPRDVKEEIEETIRLAIARRRAAGRGLRHVLAEVIPPEGRVAVRRSITNVIAPIQRRKARALANSCSHRGLYLDLGAGEYRRKGYVLVDLFGLRADIYWNLERRLPFRTSSASVIVTDHTLEHLSGDNGLRLLAECYRVLNDGGVLRVCVPDGRKYYEDYILANQPELARYYGRLDGIRRLNVFHFRNGHRYIYDWHELSSFLFAVGFRHILRSSFGESAYIASVCDNPWRATDSLYVEAKK